MFSVSISVKLVLYSTRNAQGPLREVVSHVFLTCFSILYFHLTQTRFLCIRQEKGAGVVSINSLSEHNYVTQWIKGFDNTWYVYYITRL